MLIETALSLRSGAELAIELPHQGMVDAEVVWSSGQLFGCRFLEPIGNAALSAVRLKADVPLPPRIGQLDGVNSRGIGLGRKLEQTRKARGLTLSQVAERLGVSKPTVWAWEKGKARPMDERYPAIAEALGIAPDELLDMQGAGGTSDVLEASRKEIAEALGLDIRKVRILIEI